MKNFYYNLVDYFDLHSIFSALIILILSILISLLLKVLLRKKIKSFIESSDNLTALDNLIINVPFKLLPVIIFISISIFYFDIQQNIIFLMKINKTLITLFIFIIFYYLSVVFKNHFMSIESFISKEVSIWLYALLKYLIIFLSLVAILELWGIKIGPVIAGLGLIGVAIALGAQDLFKNLISGIIILIEKRFLINDVIEVPGHATGVVEHIGFRTTLIRQFDSTPITLPNNIFSDSSVINLSNRRHRRISWIIGLTYDTSVLQLKSICKNIESSIINDNSFIVNEDYKLFVKVEKFNDSSIDILINAFTETNDWGEYLKVKENLAYLIKDIVENNDSAFAFPSKSIYIEKN